jgi:hypothetical protein
MWDVLARSAAGGKPWTVAEGLPRDEAEQAAEAEAAREASVVTLSRSTAKEA